jgi:hypothetical protein
MDRGGRNLLSSFQRVQEFLSQHAVAGAPDGLGTQAAELGDVVKRLSSEAVDQEAGGRFVRVHVKSQREMREALWKQHLQPISRVAREVFGVTGMDKAFRMPKHRSVNQPLIASARAMVEAARKTEEVFLTHGLRADFIAQLEQATTELETVRTARVESARRRVTATAAVKEQLKRGRKAVRLLNAILAPRLAKDPELLRAWESARRTRLFGFVARLGAGEASSAEPAVKAA